MFESRGPGCPNFPAVSRTPVERMGLVKRESSVSICLAVPIGLYLIMVAILGQTTRIFVDFQTKRASITTGITGVLVILFSVKICRRNLTPGLLELFGSITMSISLARYLFLSHMAGLYSNFAEWCRGYLETGFALVFLGGLFVILLGVLLTNIVAEARELTYMPSGAAAFGYLTLVCSSCLTTAGGTGMFYFSRMEEAPILLGIPLFIGGMCGWLPLIVRRNETKGHPWISAGFLIVGALITAVFALGTGLEWQAFATKGYLFDSRDYCIAFSIITVFLLLTLTLHLTTGFLYAKVKLIDHGLDPLQQQHHSLEMTHTSHPDHRWHGSNDRPTRP